MRKVTIELEELLCKWLEHISELTGASIEKVIENTLYNQIAAIEKPFLCSDE